MDCGVCSCEGDSADGTIEVFDNPSSGERVSRQSAVGRNELYGRFLRFLYELRSMPTHLTSLVYFLSSHTNASEKAFRRWNKLCILSTRGDRCRSSCPGLSPHARRAGSPPSSQPLPGNSYPLIAPPEPSLVNRLLIDFGIFSPFSDHL